jgi:hypothetical protein
MIRVFTAAAVLFGSSLATSALADPPQLKGEYGFTGTAACLVSPSGFDAMLRPINAATSFTRSFSVEGIRTFNGDGTGSVKGTVVGIVVRPDVAPSAGSADFQFDFTYVVNADGSWTSTMVQNSYTETFTSGPRSSPRQTATIDAIPPISGMVSQNGMTLTAAHLQPVVETHTYSNGDVEPQICHRSRILIALRPAGS